MLFVSFFVLSLWKSYENEKAQNSFVRAFVRFNAKHPNNQTTKQFKNHTMAKERLYYSIREVAEMFQINQSNLRYWEKEFKQLKPKRNDKGTRFYTQEDIQVVKQIIFLTIEQKLTLNGAKKRLGEKKDSVAKQQELAERLMKIRSELKGMIAQMRKGEE